MPLHDWSRVGDWVFADFRLHWLVEFSHALKAGSLAEPYAAMIQWVDDDKRHKRLAIRDLSNERIVTVIDIVSPGNKAGDTEFRRFVGKAVRAIRADVNVLILDPWPPTPRDPNGIHGAIWPKLGGKPYTAPSDRPLTFAAYEVADEDAGLGPRCYVEPSVAGEPLPEMPLFLSRDHYVNVPLEPCYQTAFRNVPPQFRAVLEAA